MSKHQCLILSKLEKGVRLGGSNSNTPLRQTEHIKTCKEITPNNYHCVYISTFPIIDRLGANGSMTWMNIESVE